MSDTSKEERVRCLRIICLLSKVVYQEGSPLTAHCHCCSDHHQCHSDLWTRFRFRFCLLRDGSYASSSQPSSPGEHPPGKVVCQITPEFTKISSLYPFYQDYPVSSNQRPKFVGTSTNSFGFRLLGMIESLVSGAGYHCEYYCTVLEYCSRIVKNSGHLVVPNSTVLQYCMGQKRQPKQVWVQTFPLFPPRPLYRY